MLGRGDGVGECGSGGARGRGGWGAAWAAVGIVVVGLGAVVGWLRGWREWKLKLCAGFVALLVDIRISPNGMTVARRRGYVDTDSASGWVFCWCS